MLKVDDYQALTLSKYALYLSIDLVGNLKISLFELNNFK